MKRLVGRRIGRAIKAMLTVLILGLPLVGCGPEEKENTPEETEKALEKEKEISYREWNNED